MSYYRGTLRRLCCFRRGPRFDVVRGGGTASEREVPVLKAGWVYEIFVFGFDDFGMGLAKSALRPGATTDRFDSGFAGDGTDTGEPDGKTRRAGGGDIGVAGVEPER